MPRGRRPCEYARGRLEKTSFTADTHSILVSTCCQLPWYASTAWVSASMPVAAVIGGGIPFIITGSSAAAIGTSFGSITTFFSCFAESVTTATTVTSDPVPAVVGTANNGSGGLPTLSIPTSCDGAFPLVAIAAMTLAASIDEPPPNASIESLPWARTADRPACSTASVGSGTMPSNTATSMPSASSALCTGSTRPSLTSTASVAIMVRRAPDPPMSPQSLAVEPAPTSSTGRGIGTHFARGFLRVLARRRASRRSSNSIPVLRGSPPGRIRRPPSWPGVVIIT